MFASSLTKQIPIYASWLLDPGSSPIDAFAINWNNIFIYAFPIMEGNCITYNHSQSIHQTSWNQRETSTLSETSDVGPINLEPVSSIESISSDVQAIILASWRNTTNTKYNSTFKRWTNFCS